MRPTSALIEFSHPGSYFRVTRALLACSGNRRRRRYDNPTKTVRRQPRLDTSLSLSERCPLRVRRSWRALASRCARQLEHAPWRTSKHVTNDARGAVALHARQRERRHGARKLRTAGWRHPDCIARLHPSIQGGRAGWQGILRLRAWMVRFPETSPAHVPVRPAVRRRR